MDKLIINKEVATQIKDIFLNENFTEEYKTNSVKKLTKDLYTYKDNTDYLFEVGCGNDEIFLNIYECNDTHTIPYTRTWCDYLTKCPHFPDIEVGSYECCNCCMFHVEAKEDNKKFEPCDYSRYSALINGYIKCRLDYFE